MLLRNLHPLTSSFVAVSLLGLAACAQTGSHSSEATLENWVLENHYPVELASNDTSDLHFLAPMLEGVRVVSFGEGLHASEEPLLFRNKLFRYLASDHGFTALGMESGVMEGLVVNDFVTGGPGEAADIARHGMTYGFGELPQQTGLLDWMRDRNSGGGASGTLEFYGFDISTGRTENGSIEQALSYLGTVAPKDAFALRARLEPHLDKLWINRFSADGEQYAGLSQPDRDAVTSALADLLVGLEMNERPFIAATSEDTYFRARLAALASFQADRYLRQFPVGWTPDQGPVLGSVSAADIGKLENINWMLDGGPQHDRVMLFAHFGHLAPTPVSIRLPDGTVIDLPEMVGGYLVRRRGEEVLTIGHLIGSDRTACGSPPRLPVAGSLEDQLSAAVPQDFVIDLRSAPPAIRSELSGPHGLFGTQPTHALDLIEGADLLLFTHEANPAIACAEDIE